MNIVYPKKKPKGEQAVSFSPSTLLKHVNNLSQKPTLYIRTTNGSYPLMDVGTGGLISAGVLGSHDRFVEVKHTLNIEE